jgi:hypothetical protein
MTSQPHDDFIEQLRVWAVPGAEDYAAGKIGGVELARALRREARQTFDLDYDREMRAAADELDGGL